MRPRSRLIKELQVLQVTLAPIQTAQPPKPEERDQNVTRSCAVELPIESSETAPS